MTRHRASVKETKAPFNSVATMIVRSSDPLIAISANSFLRRTRAIGFFAKMRVLPSSLLVAKTFMTKTTDKKTATGIKLGSLVKDTITGFTGIAIGRTEFGFGCIHIRVQAKGLTKEGDPIPAQSFDDQRIEVLEPPTKVWHQSKDPLIKLGDVIRDALTGAVGIAVAKTVNLDGHISFIIEQSGLTECGEPKPPFYVSADRAVVVSKSELKVSKDSVATSGGPMARVPGT